MLEGKHILAVVPARSGSKGIPHKNMRTLKGTSLIGWAGKTLSQLAFIDARIISTDSPEYASEGKRYGLEAFFLRPKHLSVDTTSAIETMQHALQKAERHYAACFDIILIVEPTSPLRISEDIEHATRRLIETGADSVVTVSPLPSKSHPQKILALHEGRLRFFQSEGNQITARQMLSGDLYWRNGICYALTRTCLMEYGVIFTERTLPEVIMRPIVNIDEPIDLDWAEFLLDKYYGAF